ncbi:MAG: maltosaccharide ABC transporter permease MalD [Anaerolineae bacterium]
MSEQAKTTVAGLPIAMTASLKRRRRLAMAGRILVAVLALGYALLPVLYVISASFNPLNTLSSTTLIPRQASLENFQRLLNDPVNPFLRWMWNSLKVSVIAAVLSTLVSAISAYAFSRFRFRGRRTLLLSVFLVQVFPNSLTMVATFLLLQLIGRHVPSFGLNAHGGLILVYLGGAMGINTWLMKGYFDTVPRDIDESAMIDGASHWQIFWRIIFPLVRPIIAVVTMLTFISAYNDYLFALLLLRDNKLWTLAVGLNTFLSGQFTREWGVFAAGALMGAVPIVAIYLILQDYIVGGLTQGAVKS